MSKEAKQSDAEVDTKAITSDIEAWLSSLSTAGRSTIDEPKLRASVTAIKALKKEIKLKKSEKSAISRQFKGATAEEKSALKSQMQTNSVELKTLEEQLSDENTRLVPVVSAAISNSDQAENPAAQKSPPYMQKRYPTSDIAPKAYSIQAVTQQEWQAWDEYVLAHPSGNFYQTTALCQCISALFKQRFYGYVATNENQQICGVLPLVRLTSKLFGDFAVSVPYFNYGGALADNADIEKALMEFASTELLEAGVSHIEFRDTFDREWLSGHSDKASMLLALENSVDAQFSAFTPKLRAQIRRPERENVRCASGGTELLNDFYTVFAINMRDLGTPVYTKQLFANLLEQFPQHCSLQIVYLDDKPVSCGFLLHYKNVMEIPWASTLQSVNHLSMNMLLYWHVLQYAINTGAEWFDFGRSSIDAGTYKFKRQWGAEPIMHRWHFALPEGQTLPQINPNNPKFKLMIAVWQRLPVWLTKIIGPPVVKNIP